MAWFKKDKRPKAVRDERERSALPEGLWTRCDGCREIVYTRELESNCKICPKCGYHFRIDVAARLALLLDEEAPLELFASVRPADPLRFVDSKPYAARLAAYQKALGVADAVKVVEGTLDSIPVVLAAMDYRFMGGSMGSVVGEKFARAATYSRDNKMPLINFSASGGARMQEALFSLLQMAKTSAVLATLAEARVPFVSVLTDPTTGGVSASLGMLGDVNIAEPKALIGFAGPRVIQQTVRETLPEGFQRSEFLLEHGAVDMIVDRRRMRDEIAALLAKLTKRPAPEA
jgi:acetyl-CoA carboxylase carboxyl transferase subunit beta